MNPWLSHVAVIDDVMPEIQGVSTYRLRLRDPEVVSRYRFRPGQFNMLYLPGVGECAISVSSDASTPDRLDHTIRVAGSVTQFLEKMRPGETIGLRGPYGSWWPLEPGEDNHIVLVAGGIGLAPLRPAIYELLAHRDRFQRLTLLYGGRSPDVLLYRSEFERWTSRGLTILTTVDRAPLDWKGSVGVVPLLLDRMAMDDPGRTRVLMCGPEVMMKYCAKSALARGVPPESLWISAERNMQCAVGLCGHCQWGPGFVCKDGPVFRYDRVVRILSVEGL